MSNLNIAMVVVDKDRNSLHAFRWATQNIDNPIIIAVHVKRKGMSHHQGTNVFRPDEDDLENIFYQLREECPPNVVKMKEAVIGDSDVARGIVEYARRNHVHTIVIGAPATNKNPLAKSLLIKAVSRRYKGPDIPSTIMKTAPDYSSVYVISKGKVVAERKATCPLITTETHAHPPSESGKAIRSQTLHNHTLRSGSTNERSGRMFVNERSQSARRDSMMESFDRSYSYGGLRRRSPFSYHNSSSFDGSDFSGSMVRRNRSDLDQSFSSNSPSPLQSLRSTREQQNEVEAEMIRLRATLQHTMDLYNLACKEAIVAQNKAKEIAQWKMEEARKVEEARVAEEAALALAEEEKAKAKAAMEAAQEAMKLSEKEAQQRQQAEMKVKKEAQEKNWALSCLAQRDARYRKYNIEDIEKATQSFSLSMKIGQGGYGPVFRGQLDHTPVAIKILSPDATQGWKQFNTEVEVLCSIKHPNLVLLLGACPDYGCLVYEYMDYGSLEDRLLRKQNTPPIPWPKRFEIAAEIATALLFLHQTKPEPLVHRDLKPANILLNRNYVSKISDVGLSRLVPPSVADSVTQYYMTSAAGTFCYIDPEYQQTGMLTTKSDIYSLGIMLLQIITARPAMGLSHYVKRAIEKGTFSDMLDPAITNWPIEEALAFAKLALSCSELSKKDRPDLASVVVPELNRLREFGYESLNQIKNRSHHYATTYTRPHTPTSIPQ